LRILHTDIEQAREEEEKLEPEEEASSSLAATIFEWQAVFSQFLSTQKALEEDACTMESKLTQLEEKSFTSGLMNPHSARGCNNPCVSNKG
jgi:hypothetical protein